MKIKIRTSIILLTTLICISLYNSQKIKQLEDAQESSFMSDKNLRNKMSYFWFSNATTFRYPGESIFSIYFRIKRANGELIRFPIYDKSGTTGSVETGGFEKSIISLFTLKNFKKESFYVIQEDKYSDELRTEIERYQVTPYCGYSECINIIDKSKQSKLTNHELLLIKQMIGRGGSYTEFGYHKLGEAGYSENKIMEFGYEIVPYGKENNEIRDTISRKSDKPE